MSQAENNPRSINKTDQKVIKQIVLSIKVAEWWPIYIKSVMLFCWTFGTKPDPAAVARMARKAIKVTTPRTKKDKGLNALFSALLSSLVAWGGGSNR